MGYPGAPPVLDGVDLQLGRGEFVVLGGANGAGKSTLLRLLAGELRPQAGTIALEGRPLGAWGRRELARAVAVVPQEAPFGFAFTVGEIVLMGRAPHLGRLVLEGPEDVAQARAALAALELEPLADRPLDRLSGGERRRVAIARALCQQPRLLLLDEPTAFLDVRHRVALFGLLDRLRREQGLAILATSHDLDLAAQYATGMALLASGRLIATGSPEQVLRPEPLERAFGVAPRRSSATRAPAGPACCSAERPTAPALEKRLDAALAPAIMARSTIGSVGPGSRGKTVRVRRGPAAVTGDESRRRPLCGPLGAGTREGAASRAIRKPEDPFPATAHGPAARRRIPATLDPRGREGGPGRVPSQPAPFISPDRSSRCIRAPAPLRGEGLARRAAARRGARGPPCCWRSPAARAPSPVGFRRSRSPKMRSPSPTATR
ncbi:MAG: hypothetical protein KatS3mg102_1741 [Planctomycetota bacterium]|nr:MAG: hypothetical protein KatS3mg102_1741 [Planctomycetota bacterium]